MLNSYQPTAREVCEDVCHILRSAGFHQLSQGTRTSKACCLVQEQRCGEEGFDVSARADEAVIEIEHVSSCWCLSASSAPLPPDRLAAWGQQLEMYNHALIPHGYRCLIVRLRSGRVPLLRAIPPVPFATNALLSQQVETILHGSS